MRSLDFYIKHSFSSLADQRFQVEIDDDAKIVLIATDTFDSSLVSVLVSRLLLDGHGVTAFVDDNDYGQPRMARPYQLRIRIGGDKGVTFNAMVVRLNEVFHKESLLAITLTPEITS